MAIIKCDDVSEIIPISTGSFENDAIVEAYVEQDEVRLGKTLLAVESGFFLSDTLNPILSDVPSAEALLKTRPQDITDSLRADSNRYWTLDELGNMKYMNNSLVSREENVNSQFPLPPIQMALYNNSAQDVGQTKLGFTIVQEEILITRWSDSFPTFELFESFINGTDYPTSPADPSEGTFTRTSPLIPTGSTFTDHAFQMNTPFSKKELEMFANIVGSVSAADVESDYDFFSKAYEEGIALATVPENALPHLYTEVQRGVRNPHKSPVTSTDNAMTLYLMLK